MRVKMPASQILPVLPLRDIVVFPGMIVPLFVGREKSIKALEAAAQNEVKQIFLVTQKDAAVDNPEQSELYSIGVVSTVLQLLKLPDGTVKALVEAHKRAKLSRIVSDEEFIEASVVITEDKNGDATEVEALVRSVSSQFEQFIKLNKKVNPDILTSLSDAKEPTKLADIIAAQLTLKIADKQQVLEALNIKKRLEKVYGLLEAEIGVLNTEKKIRTRVKKQMEKTQKEYYLNEQLKAIQKELGEGEDSEDSVTALENLAKKLKLTKEARTKAYSEIKKLRMMSHMSAEASVIRNYLDWLLSLPWSKKSAIKSDLKLAQKTLDEDHYGLEKVKERILEYLAVQQRTKSLKGPILCLVGPPGVGKTSLAKSIADAIGRNFVRISLGGIRDEAEIRGHRRTYIGALPGKIIQAMKKAKTSNPLLLLDEIDKIGLDYRGDPASALLEVLDPEQNVSFVDHYIEVEYSLADVMFVATANSLNLPRPLLDRMEVIRISGYIEDEKVEIAKRHLIPKQMKLHGLASSEWSISDEAIRELIRYYTREAGVRNLEREIANLTRKAVKEILLNQVKQITLTPRNLNKYAGVKKYMFGEAEETDLVGITTGLAYTETGGDLLMIESVILPGKGNIKTTGKLGDVMQESAQAAFSYVKSRSHEFGISTEFYQKHDIHIHVPEGATPKDGPSAGIAMFTSIVSALTGIPIKRSVAMTGEITLRGRVLAIGGLKEKLLAALRGGIKTVLIPKENVKDLSDIPNSIKKHLEIIPVATADEVLKVALTSLPQPIPLAAGTSSGHLALPSSSDSDPLRPH